jgi:acyl carrier protein
MVAERINIIKDVVADVLEIEPTDLTEESRFVEDHGADSLRAIEIMSRLEKKFGVQIPQNDLTQMTNVSNVYTILRAHAGWEE